MKKIVDLVPCIRCGSAHYTDVCPVKRSGKGKEQQSDIDQRVAEEMMHLRNSLFNAEKGEMSINDTIKVIENAVLVAGDLSRFLKERAKSDPFHTIITDPDDPCLPSRTK